MKTVKMSLVNIKGKLSRTEMKQVLGGLVEPGEPVPCSGKCSYLGTLSPTDWREGTCVNTTIPMQVGCACKKEDDSLIAGCIS